MRELWIAMALVFAVDRACKALASGRWSRRPHPIRAGGLSFQLVRNPGPAGWAGESALGWGVLVAVALVAAWLLARGNAVGPATSAGLGAAIGGALGNLYDRVRHGAVLDLVEVGRSGAFNPADAAIVLGLAMAWLSYALSFVPARTSI